MESSLSIHYPLSILISKDRPFLFLMNSIHFLGLHLSILLEFHFLHGPLAQHCWARSCHPFVLWSKSLYAALFTSCWMEQVFISNLLVPSSRKIFNIFFVSPTIPSFFIALFFLLGHSPISISPTFPCSNKYIPLSI